jgi:hypothetical protein
MTVVGLWSQQTIKASYELNSNSLRLAILAITVAGVLVVSLGGRRKALFLLAWGSAVISTASYVLLVHQLAESLCVEAPLDVKAQGVIMVPFFLGTKGAGLSVLGALFLFGNAVMLLFRGTNTGPSLLLLNGVFLVSLAAMAFAAYWAASLGYGIPLSHLNLQNAALISLSLVRKVSERKKCHLNP